MKIYIDDLEYKEADKKNYEKSGYDRKIAQSPVWFRKCIYPFAIRHRFFALRNIVSEK